MTPAAPATVHRRPGWLTRTARQTTPCSRPGMRSCTDVQPSDPAEAACRPSKDTGQSRQQLPTVDRPSERFPTWDGFSGRQRPHRTLKQPAFALVRAYVEPPAGIEPATPSLPWNHQEPLCEPPFPQVAADRRGQSYGFSFGEGMRSLPGHALRESERLPNDVIGQHRFPFHDRLFALAGRHQSAEQYGSSDHRRTAASAAPRTAALSTSTPDGGIPRSAHTQTKARGPGGGRGRTR